MSFPEPIQPSLEKQQSTFALTQFQPGYNHRLTDGKNTCIQPGADQDKCGHDYLSQPGKGFINQTKEFIDGYVTGFLRHEILEDIREFCAVIDRGPCRDSRRSTRSAAPGECA